MRWVGERLRDEGIADEGQHIQVEIASVLRRLAPSFVVEVDECVQNARRHKT